MFASTWPYGTPLSYWTTHSEIIRCVSDTPEGPFTYQSQALPPGERVTGTGRDP